MGNSKKKQKTGRDKLPALPSVGNQRKWDIVKVVLRSICLALSIADIAELIAIDYSASTLGYRPSVAYPVVSLTMFTSGTSGSLLTLPTISTLPLCVPHYLR